MNGFLKCKDCGAAEGEWCDPHIAAVCIGRERLVVKPIHGTSPMMLDATSGVHPPHSNLFIRGVRPTEPFTVSLLTKEDKAWILEETMVYSKWLIEGRDYETVPSPTQDIEAFLAKAKDLVLKAVKEGKL